MLKRFLPILVLAFPLMAEEEAPYSSFLPKAEEQHIIINNRPLVKVFDKTFSLMDVVKRMDLFLHRYWPAAFDSKASLYQYYMGNWRVTLDEMVNNQFILKEAEEKKMEVSDGEVREEMEERFGPNIMANLDKLHLTYEEAKEHIHEQLVVGKLTGYFVHSKALQDVGPQKIKDSYAIIKEKNPNSDLYTYQVLSVSGSDEKLCEEAAKRASSLLSAGLTGLSEAAEKVREEFEGVKIRVGNDYVVESTKLSPMHKQVLAALDVGEVSLPENQKSRANPKGVWRLFHLKDHVEKQAVAFKEKEEEIKSALLRERLDVHQNNFTTTLRKKYNFTSEEIEQNIPENYQPFIMQ
ncbi:MAG: hypothetical protein SNF33_04680 [Candidatus Algichlamydia australiensis]|nr:hypothetical protein [Chlamydiales bacterium]